ncbi:hypothetical protein [Marinobacterium rhizophilum]|uniref:Uncharacterized protein n=1 Tax=Marinobacterium rhizophilum TaxID=420402 RepID=A0ABY5HIM9_9GAMM|nr:hypothetical protein [Marinobacterium rhizophilum]UTW11463.1 hypothetical protein KDW95_19730 [Marinobacterium rhizophilum]
MNFRDPFGRQEKRREREYASLRQKLPGAGVTTRADAEQLIENVGKRGKYGLMAVIALTLLLMLLIPEGRIICGAAGTLVGAWAYITSRKIQGHVKRYIQEELTPDSDDESATPDDSTTL